jgi:uncharacterized radical SAM protein YgiQ
MRPDRASLVYTSLLKHAFPGLPVIMGGIEASLRRVSHYDFWSDSIRRSLLLDAKADLLVYGMGERALLDIVARLHREAATRGRVSADRARKILAGIAGTGAVTQRAEDIIPPGAETIWLPSHEEILSSPAQLMAATLALERQVQRGTAWAVQAVAGRDLVLAPRAALLTEAELDELYSLPFTRRAHPLYSERIPALATIQFSITTHRGCAGGCSFCSLALHQGRRIASRSPASILAEADAFTRHPDFKVSVSDVGGPSANMWGASCASDPGQCRRPSCLTPSICKRFRHRQAELTDLLHQIAHQPGIKNLRVASGVRHDLALLDPKYLRALVADFTAGQLKVAPEHQDPGVLRLMRKPAFAKFETFLHRFSTLSRAAGKEQYLVPYFISAFPGCSEDAMCALAAWLKKRSWRPRQVQCFVPTPGTVATAMFYAGIDQEGRPLSVPRSQEARRRQHAVLTGDTGVSRGPAVTGGRRKRGSRRGTEFSPREGVPLPRRKR